ncbi:hypothetical protein BaRGS_00011903 [Batillaria attramentaria]|uniref:Uncharacterized protein n=1 Tax=Batillaria attramentaria TaxID=370345 RepID=A0ABD0LCE3_9CAEN
MKGGKDFNGRSGQHRVSVAKTKKGDTGNRRTNVDVRAPDPIAPRPPCSTHRMVEKKIRALDLIPTLISDLSVWMLIPAQETRSVVKMTEMRANCHSAKRCVHNAIGLYQDTTAVNAGKPAKTPGVKVTQERPEERGRASSR